DDSCNPITGCVHTPNTAACDDGDATTKFDACVAGSCVGVSLLAPLSLRAGENPSVSPAFPAGGDARLRGTTVELNLRNLDPLRFPAGSSCQTTVSAGSASGQGTMVRGVAPGSSPPRSVTIFTFQGAGTARAGDTASLRIRCTLGGVRHETQWQGTFATP